MGSWIWGETIEPGMVLRANPSRAELPLVDGTGRIPPDTHFIRVDRVDSSDKTISGTFLDGVEAESGGWITASHLQPLQEGDEEIIQEIERVHQAEMEKLDRESAEAQEKYERRAKAARSNCSSHEACPTCQHEYCGETHEGDRNAMSYFFMICGCPCTPWDGDDEGGRKSHQCCRCAAPFLDSYCDHCQHQGGHLRS